MLYNNNLVHLKKLKQDDYSSPKNKNTIITEETYQRIIFEIVNLLSELEDNKLKKLPSNLIIFLENEYRKVDLNLKFQKESLDKQTVIVYKFLKKYYGI